MILAWASPFNFTICSRVYTSAVSDQPFEADFFSYYSYIYLYYNFVLDIEIICHSQIIWPLFLNTLFIIKWWNIEHNFITDF